MATEAQILANRRNCKKSTGPISRYGKAEVSKNAVKHGLFARQPVIRLENQAEFDLFHDRIIRELAPETPMESILSERVVMLSWRLKRVARFQNQTIDAMNANNTSGQTAKLTNSLLLKARDLPQQGSSESPLGRLAIKDFSNARVLDRLLMYERRIENSLYKTIIELQRLHLIRKMDNLNRVDEQNNYPDRIVNQL
jgi:hypothetical protein